MTKKKIKNHDNGYNIQIQSFSNGIHKMCVVQ